MKTALLVAPALVMLGFAVRAAIAGWGIAPEAEIGFHGLMALLLGGAVSLLVAGGLIALMLYSRRRDFDQ